ncbi:MAG: hypothetical protein AAF446_10850, partial [Pseudomonadota bacterium]
MIRITDSEARQQAERVLVESQVVYQRDYGSYRWLVLDDAAASSLVAAKLEHEQIDNPFLIRFQNHRFDPLKRKSGSAIESADGKALRLIQLYGPALASDLSALQLQDIDVIQFYPGFAYLVWADQQALNNSRSLSFVRATTDFVSDLKAQPGLERRSERGVIENINVHFYNSGSPQAIANRFHDLGVTVLDVTPAQPDQKLWNAVISADVQSLKALADVPEVIALTYLSPEPQLEDESATQVLAGNLDMNNDPFPGYPSWLGQVGLDGNGVIW